MHLTIKASLTVVIYKIIILSLLLPSSISESFTDLRIKLIKKDTPIKSFNIPASASCPHFPSFTGVKLEKVIAVQANLYRPSFPNQIDYGFLMTAYKHQTKCSQSFWGFTDIKVTEDYPVHLTDLPQDFIHQSIHHLKSVLSDNFDGSKDMVLTSGQKLYNCKWWENDVLQTTYVFKAQKTPVVWGLDSNLLQPVKNETCNLFIRNQECQLSESSILIFTNTRSTRDLCRVTPMASMDGQLSYVLTPDDRYRVTFESYQTDFSTDLLFSLEWIKKPICTQLNGNFIWDTEEGHILEFTKKGSKNPIYLLAFQNQTKLKSEESWKREIMKSLPSRRFRRRLITDDELISEIPIAEIHITDPLTSQICPHLICNTSIVLTRFRRNTIWSYPEHQRLQLLEEHLAWGFSEINGFQNSLVDVVEMRLMQQKYRNCLLRLETIEILKRLKYKDLLAEYLLEDRSIQYLGFKDEKVYVKQGSPVPSIILPTLSTSIWCNKSLLVKYKVAPDLEEYEPGWLMNHIGLVLSFDMNSTFCSTYDAPTDFYIPTYANGSINFLNKHYVDFQYKESHLPHFKYHFLNLVPDDGMLSLLHLERSMSDQDISDEKYDLFNSLFRLYNGNQPSNFMLGELLGSLVIPILGFLIIVVLIKSLLLMICHCPSQTKLLVRKL